jgi:hypothetical protein
MRRSQKVARADVILVGQGVHPSVDNSEDRLVRGIGRKDEHEAC